MWCAERIDRIYLEVAERGHSIFKVLLSECDIIPQNEVMHLLIHHAPLLVAFMAFVCLAENKAYLELQQSSPNHGRTVYIPELEVPSLSQHKPKHTKPCVELLILVSFLA